MHYYTFFLFYSSLQYLNYPTQVIFKSCKLIPVLIGGILIQRKQKGWLDFTAAIVMSFGLAIFLLADSQVLSIFNSNIIVEAIYFRRFYNFKCPYAIYLGISKF